jgi:hypothetical protein
MTFRGAEYLNCSQSTINRMLKGRWAKVYRVSPNTVIGAECPKLKCGVSYFGLNRGSPVAIHCCEVKMLALSCSACSRFLPVC